MYEREVALAVKLSLAAALAIGWFVAVTHGASAATVRIAEAAVVLGIVVLAVAAVVVPRALDSCQGRAERRTRAAMGPLLADWLALSSPAELDPDELRDWRSAARRGLTPAEASRWSAAGLPYPLAACAVRRSIALEQVRELAETMRSCGAWDGADRRALARLIGWHIEVTDGSRYPVLHRWLRFTSAEVAAAVSREVAVSDEAWSACRPDARAESAAHHALYVLEGHAASMAPPVQ